jgi:hypothetical protein
LITKEARAWIDHVDQYELSYDAHFKTNADFGAKVLGLIDLTFFQCCDLCLKADSFADVDFAAISLEHDRQGITRNTFQANIPAYLVIQQKWKAESDVEESEEVIKKKRKMPINSSIGTWETW